MRNRIKLIYLSPNPYGGWVTFTAHLHRALQAAGCTPELVKVLQDNPKRKSLPRSETKTRDFGYGLRYRNVTLRDALFGDSPKLVVAAAKRYQDETAALVAAGAFLVVHDPTELKNLPDVPPERCVVIRRNGLAIVPGATFIPHPFVRSGGVVRPDKNRNAVSTARIDFDKNTHLILGANKLLPGDKRVQIHGFENRLYGKFTLAKKFPEWMEVQSTHNFDRKFDAAARILGPARFSVDMSVINGDGGGTQYTFLEAWDMGAVPVIHREWTSCLPADSMRPGVNCLQAGDEEELAEVLRLPPPDELELVDAGYSELLNHEPELVGTRYREFLGVGR